MKAFLKRLKSGLINPYSEEAFGGSVGASELRFMSNLVVILGFLFVIRRQIYCDGLESNRISYIGFDSNAAQNAFKSGIEWVEESDRKRREGNDV